MNVQHSPRPRKAKNLSFVSPNLVASSNGYTANAHAQECIPGASSGHPYYKPFPPIEHLNITKKF